jgi:hypothetical protein
VRSVRAHIAALRINPSFWHLSSICRNSSVSDLPSIGPETVTIWSDGSRDRSIPGGTRVSTSYKPCKISHLQNSTC